MTAGGNDGEGPMTVTVNGAARELPVGTIVATVIAELLGDTEVRGVAAAVNGAVVPRGRWPHLALADGDRLEVLTAVQGG